MIYDFHYYSFIIKHSVCHSDRRPYKPPALALLSLYHMSDGNKVKVKLKVVPVRPGLVDFAIGLVIFVLNLPDGQVLFFWEIQITEGL